MKRSILVVDDIALNRRIIKAALKSMEDVVFYDAENGMEALEAVSTQELDLIILDLMMPVKNGFDVLAELKSNTKHATIPIIIYSALDNLDNIQKALVMGAHDYFTKPLTAEMAHYVLPNKVKNAIQSYEREKQLVQLNAQLEEEVRFVRYLSFHDQTTGLYNRRFLEEELARLESIKAYPVAIIIGDINGLKLTNDVFGHADGDKLLVRIADILRGSCRERDIIARWGGDEFAVLLTDTDEGKATEICGRVRHACEQSAADPIRPSISLGWSVKTSPSQDLNMILHEAEDHMYRHKLLESKSVRSSILLSLEKTLFEKSLETEEHARRILVLAMDIGCEMGLTEIEMDELSVFSVLHDIGKIAIPDSILLKPAELTREEREVVEKHCEVGYRIAQSSQELAYISEYILSHHERWDGSGYPLGLKKTEIPRLSRILAIADAYDAMTHEQPYRKSFSHTDAMHEICRCTGSQFDPQVTEAFVKVMYKLMSAP